MASTVDTAECVQCRVVLRQNDSVCCLVHAVPQNKCAWLVSPDHDEEELLQPTSRRLPLYVQSMQWRMLSGDLAVSMM